MATAVQTTESGVVPYRLTVTQYLRMIDAGVFPDDANVELLGGMLVDKMTKHDPHNFGASQSAALLRRLLRDDWTVLEEKSVVLSRYDRPEPDVAVARGPLENYREAPRPKDLVLIVEVAESTCVKDRGAKWLRDAAAGIPIYRILNLVPRRMEVYRRPAGRGDRAAYRDAKTYDEQSSVPVVIDGREIGRIAVGDLL